MQSLLGFINWFRPYIDNLSNRIYTITNKLKAQNKFKWTEQDTALIKTLMEQIDEKTLLHFPDYDQKFELYCDASDVGMGSILKQSEFIIGYHSYKFTACECNYSITEKEAFAVVLSLDHFKNIIFGSHIDVYTDNANIIFNKLNVSKRIMRWKCLLNEYNLDLHHVKGKDNTAADYLSRIYGFSEAPIQGFNIFRFMNTN